MRHARTSAAGLVVTALTAANAWAASDADDIELQKKLANPVADLVTIPFQYNINFGSGPFDKPPKAWPLVNLFNRRQFFATVKRAVDAAGGGEGVAVRLGSMSRVRS